MLGTVRKRTLFGGRGYPLENRILTHGRAPLLFPDTVSKFSPTLTGQGLQSGRNSIMVAFLHV